MENFDIDLKKEIDYGKGVGKMGRKKKSEDWVSLSIVIVLLALAITGLYWNYIGVNTGITAMIVFLWIVIGLYIWSNLSKK
ncbi:MAG: hypothetical protein J7K61_03135 [Thermoplasmata archaeon]|nr:hypothetical protein [Thermoplasmata archaeon]